MPRFPSRSVALLVCALAPSASAQYSARRVVTKTPLPVTTSPSGGFLQGADDCAAPHVNVGSGDMFGVPFTTGTTGTTGQNETSCYAFGSSAIDGDVWFDWTSTATGTARVDTCGATTIDTKIAVYPLSTCPADGSSLACNDDACPGFQTTAAWSATAGTTYTLQVGTFPGASGGSGTFDVTVTPPPPCGRYDDGSSENSLGLTAGGEMGWYQSFSCTSNVTGVLTAYGSLALPGSIPNGGGSRVAIYDDTDADPSSGASLVAVMTTSVVNANTDILNQIPLAASTTGGFVGILATADHFAGEFPGPMDEDDPTPAAWVVGSTLGPGSLDLQDLSNNSVPPLNMAAIGFPAAWLLRAETGPPPAGTALCFGDGSGAACGCGNEAPSGTGGCLNSLGVGALLGATGTPDVLDDTLRLVCAGVRAQPGLFFQGDNVVAGGAGATFGDGVRCCGQNVVRLQIVVPPSPEPTTADMTVSATTSGPLGTIQPGDTKCYQYWYRDPGGSPCGGGFNLSNGFRVTWFAGQPAQVTVRCTCTSPEGTTTEAYCMITSSCNSGNGRITHCALACGATSDQTTLFDYTCLPTVNCP